MKSSYIEGKRLYLRPPEEKDIESGWFQWFNDEETTKYLADRYWPNTADEQKEFMNSLSKKHNRMVLLVVDMIDDVLIGVAGISQINWVHRYGDVSMVFGNKDYRKGPLAIEAFSLLLRVAFRRLNLLNVKSAYSAANKGSEALHRALKFKRVGEYPDLLWDGERYNGLVVEVLDRTSWEMSKPS